jgi:hypothetical protein
MKPITFDYVNTVFAENQPEYLPLPAHKTENGLVVTCWELTVRERIKILFTGRLWWTTHTFNHPLQPQSASIDSPFAKEKKS